MLRDFEKRIECWKDTVDFCNRNTLVAPSSTKYVFNPNYSLTGLQRYARTDVTIQNKDSIEIGLEFKRRGLNPLVLNFADDVFPGGHVAVGSGAQEEALFRRTNYFTTLTHFFYPLEGTQSVYSPNVSVIKDPDFLYYPEVKHLSFIACPGLRHPPLTKEGDLRDEDEKLLSEKIETIFQVAYEKRHDCLVLGALGCGAWNNPPEEVARLFKRVCLKWDSIFREIVFAVLEVDTKDYIVKTRNSMLGISNFKVFGNVFAT